MKSRNILTSIVLLTSIFLTTIVYSAFSTQLNIEGEAIVRSDQEIRVTNITVKSSSNGAYETYNNKYNKDTTSMYVTLPSNSSITYEIEITNKSNDSYLIDSITQESNTNSNVNISLNENDIVESNNTKKFTITLTNNTSSEQQEALVYKYGFKLNKFIVSFDANGGNVSQTSKEVSYGSNYGALPTPTRTGYTFKGWVIEDTILPNDYYQVDYIESTRTQYIDTNYIPKIVTKLELDLSFNGEFRDVLEYGGVNAFLGVYDNNGQSAYSINYSGGESGGNYLFPWFNKQYLVDGTGAQGFAINDDIRTNRNTLTIENGQITYGTTGRTITAKSSNNINSMYLFGNNGIGNHDDSSQMPTGPFTSYNMKVYDMKMYENNELVRHYIPCLRKSDNKVGLHDILNNTFYENQGTGEFQIGYITSSSKVTLTSNHTLKAMWEPNIYTVTFDYNDEVTASTSKYVTYDSTYGALPNPTRAGYTFKGWHGKNLIKDTISENVNIPHFVNRTTHEFKNDGNFSYIRINGYQENSDIDTLWRIIFLDKFKVLGGKDYTLSFYVRSANALQPQSIMSANYATTGKTGIYYNNDAISNIRYYLTKSIEFSNDGEWHKISIKFPVTSTIENSVLIIGNDVPNLCGINSYMDISQVQLEEGSVDTPYEPYYVEDTTAVVQPNNHTLTAIWEKN